MAESLKRLKTRIRTIENTGKIARAMEMISISKLKRIETLLNAQRFYYRALDSLLMRASAYGNGFTHPLMKEKKVVSFVVVCVITSDTGLCGTYNSAIIKSAEGALSQWKQRRIRLVTIGKRGFTYFRRRGFDVSHSFVGLNGRYSAQTAAAVTDKLCLMFNSGEAEEVYVAHMHFESLARYRPAIERLLPVQTLKDNPFDCILEPNAERIIEELLPRYLKAKIGLLLIESFIAEHACRMVAMKTASDNAQELRDVMELLKNKARQSAITKEVIEIISSSG